MDVYKTNTYVLSVYDEPLVASFAGVTAGLDFPGWYGMPEGFTIHFHPVHIAVLEELLEVLRRKVPSNDAPDCESRFLARNAANPPSKYVPGKRSST